jgi:periplasmic protein TonB
MESVPEAATWEALEAGAGGPGAVEPAVINRPEVSRELERRYAALAPGGIQGTVEVQVYVDADGWVRHARLLRSSGREAIDRAGQEVALVFRFSPARVGDEPVPVWLTLPIGFAAVR